MWRVRRAHRSSLFQLEAIEQHPCPWFQRVPRRTARGRRVPEFAGRKRHAQSGGEQRHERHRRQRAFDPDAIGKHSDKRHASPPIPHAKPIISDDTVAALMGAIIWPNVTLTGSVDCSRQPADRHERHEWPSRLSRRDGQKRDGKDERPQDDVARAPAIGERAAEESADAADEQIDGTRQFPPRRPTCRAASASPA